MVSQQRDSKLSGSLGSYDAHPSSYPSASRLRAAASRLRAAAPTLFVQTPHFARPQPLCLDRLMVAIVAILAVLASACCHPTEVRVPTPIIAPPCLDTLPPDPPAVDAGDRAWVDYHVELEGWAAMVTRACGAHLLGADP